MGFFLGPTTKFSPFQVEPKRRRHGRWKSLNSQNCLESDDFGECVGIPLDSVDFQWFSVFMSPKFGPKPWHPGGHFHHPKNPWGIREWIRRPMASSQAAQDGLETATSEGRGPCHHVTLPWGDFAGNFLGKERWMGGRHEFLMFHKGNYELSVSKFELWWYWEHDQLDFCGWVSKQLHQSIMKRSFLKQNTITSNSKVLDQFEMMNISAENLIGFMGNNGETYTLQSHGIGIRDPGEHVNQIGDLDWQAGKLRGFKLNPFCFSTWSCQVEDSKTLLSWLLTLDFC